ncbi:tape measure protein [Corynebacterium humireducens]|nr:tape measure protein [Corynebacterium humireducens]
MSGRVQGVLSQAASAAGRAAGSIRTHLTTSFHGAEQAALRIPPAITGIAGALVAVAGPMAMLKGGFDRLMDMQRAEIMFKNIGLTSEQTEAQMAKLSDQVTGTSVSLSDAAKYSAMFAQSGVKMGTPMDDTIKAFTNLSAAAQGSGTDVGAVLQQISAAGRLMGGDAMQLQQAGINIYNYVAEYMGKSVEEVKKLGEEGKITFEDVIGAINAGMGDFAKEMGETLPAKMSNFQTAIKNLGATILEPFIPGMTAAVEFGIAVTKGAVAPLKRLIGWFEEGGRAAEVTAGVVQALGAGLALAFTPGVVGLVMSLGVHLKALGAAVWAATGPVGIVIGLVAALVAGFVILWKRSEAFRGFWIGLWESVKSAAAPAVEWVQDALDTVGKAWEELTTALRGGDSGYGALEQLIGTGAARFIMDTITTVQEGWEKAAGVVSQVWDVMRGVFEATGSAVWSALGSVAGALWSVFQSLAQVVGAVVKTVWEVVKALAPVLLPILKVLGAVIGGVVLAALGLFIGALLAVAKVVEVVAKVIGWLAENVLAPLIGVIADVVSWLVEKLAGAFVAVVDAVRDAAQWVRDAWTGMVEGLRAGWDAYGQPVIDAVVAVFGGLWTGVSWYLRYLAGLWNVVVVGLGLAWANYGQPVVDWVVEKFAWLSDRVRAGLDWVAEKWNEVTAWLGVQWASYGQPVVDAVVGGFVWLRDRVVAMLTVVIGWFTTTGRAAVGLWQEYVAPMIDWVVSGFQRLSDTIKGWKDNVVAWFRDAGSWLYNAGADIVNGLISGVKSKAGAMRDAFLSVVPGWAKDAFKEGMGIASPSRVFAEYGRNIGEGLIEGIGGMQAAVSAAAGGLVDAATPTGGLSPAVVPTVAAAPDGGAWESMTAAVVAATDDTLSPALVGLQQTMADTATTTVDQAAGVITPAWADMAAGVATAQGRIIAPALAGVQQNMAATAAAVATATGSQITPAWASMASGIMQAKVSTIDPAFAGIRGGLSTVVGAFANGANAVGQHMSRMRDLTATPVRFTITSIFNDGVVGMWNSVADLLGTSKMSPYPVRFNRGGVYDVLPGYTPGKDVYRFINPATGAAVDLSGGEAIMRPEVTRALGTHEIDGLNAAARLGGVKGVEKYLGRFAGGGVVPSITALVRRFFPGMSITSTYRNTPDLHGAGMAVDFSDGYDTTPGMQAAARFFHQNYGRMLAELIHYPLRGWQNIKNGRPLNYGPATNAQHRNHVHVASRVPLPAPGNVTSSFDGAGWDVDMDWMSMFAGDAEKKLTDAIKNAPKGGGLVDQWPPKIGDKLHNAVRKKAEEEFEKSFSMTGGGGNVEQWAPMVSALLRLYGHPASWLQNTLRRMNQESGGDPRAINLWDINAMRGDPSKGLMQVIGSTFARWRDLRFPNNIWDPRANTAASMRYTMATYGSLPAGYDRAGGYHLGGIMGEGQGWFHKTAFEPERVLSARQTESFERLVDWLDATPEPVIRQGNGGTGGPYGGGVSRQVHVTQNIVTPDPKAAADAVEDRLTRLLV